MLMDYEEYIDQPNVTKLSASEQRFMYIVGVATYEDYEEALEYILSQLENPEENIQAAAIQGIDTLIYRFRKIDEERALPILLDNVRLNNNKRLVNESMEALYGAVELMHLREKIYSAFFEMGVDFHTGERLPIYKHKIEFNSLEDNTQIEKYILSLCQNCDSFEEAFEACLKILAQKEQNSDNTNIAVLNGLTYVVMRFKKINFDKLLPLLLKFLPPEEEIGNVYAEGLLADIALFIPELKKQSVAILKQINSHICEKYNL